MNDCYVIIGKKCSNCDAFGHLPGNEWSDKRFGFACQKCNGKGWIELPKSMPISEAIQDADFRTVLQRVGIEIV